MQHIIHKYLGADKKKHHHYETKCGMSVATPQKLVPPPKGEPMVVEVEDGNMLCKSCDAAQYNISQPIGNFVNSASKTGFMKAKPDGDAVGKDEAVIIEGYGVDGELSSDDGLGAYEQT